MDFPRANMADTDNNSRRTCERRQLASVRTFDAAQAPAAKAAAEMNRCLPKKLGQC